MMERYKAEIACLTGMQHPTTNSVTDQFGFYRHWSADTWHPKAAYSPIHSGVDFSAGPNSHIIAPCDGEIWGGFLQNAVGSYIMLRPTVEGKPSEDIALYFYHCEPTASEWRGIYRSERMTEHAGHGIGAPHLHLECAVTADIAQALFVSGLLDLHRITKRHWMEKARDAGIVQSQAYQRIQQQKREWNITAVYSDAIVRAALPPAHWKRSKRSKVYSDQTYVIDLPSIWGRC